MFKKNYSLSDKIFDTFNVTVMVLLCFVTIYPFWNLMVLSLNDGLYATVHPVSFWPNKFSLQNFTVALQNKQLLGSIQFTVIMTITYTIFGIIVTGLCAYALAKSDLPGRKAITTFLWVAGWFSGGIIPTFMVYREYGLLNNFWVFILPGAFSFYNFLLFRTHFRDIPMSIEESALIDGSGYLQIFFKIICPMSLPIFATIALFNAVGAWNNWMTSLVYAYKNENLRTLQYYLNRLLQEAVEIQEMIESAQKLGLATDETKKATATPQSIRAAVTMFATVPILLVYPFLQKYFVKGVRLGAVKG